MLVFENILSIKKQQKSEFCKVRPLPALLEFLLPVLSPSISSILVPLLYPSLTLSTPLLLGYQSPTNHPPATPTDGGGCLQKIPILDKENLVLFLKDHLFLKVIIYEYGEIQFWEIVRKRIKANQG